MATIKIYPDTRRQKKDGTSQIKIVVYHASKQRYIPTGLDVLPEQWDAAKGLAKKNHPLQAQINIRIQQLRLAAEAALLTLPPNATIDEAVSAVEAAATPERQEAKRDRRILLNVATEFARLKKGATREGYNALLNHLAAYDRKANISDIGRSWLMGFDAHLDGLGISLNGRAVYMRYLRAICNYAIDEGITNNYPFRKFRVRTQATVKRSLTLEELRHVLTVDVEEWQRPYRDMFALSFLLIGTNLKDVLHLPGNADASGRIEFHRAKTKKLYSIKVEPEARALIDLYRGKDHMIATMDTRRNYREYVKQCNHALQAIGVGARKESERRPAPLYPELTTYWARHTWATLAAELDIPKETIAAALGHDMGNTTTAIYINYNQRKVDEANRRVIDYVLGLGVG